MSTNVKTKMGLLVSRVDALAISQSAIARRYGCSRQFVHLALNGRKPMPALLRRTIAGMIAERDEEINQAMGRSGIAVTRASRKRRAS